MAQWFVNRLKEYETTIAGLVLGAAAGAGYSIQQGQVSKEAIAIGAGIGAVGALSKTPTWARVFKGVRDADNSSVGEGIRGGDEPKG